MMTWKLLKWLWFCCIALATSGYAEVVTQVGDDVVAPEDQAAEKAAANAEPVLQKPEWLEKHYTHVYWIKLEGVIGGRSAWYLENRLKQAKREGADLVVVEITSPGGEMEASLKQARQIRDVDWATTVAFIPAQAISGGAITALGADYIVMQRGALIGDAGPVQLGVHGFERAEEKIVSYLAAAVGELARAKGRPPALVRAMVDRNAKVYQATDKQTGRTVFVSEADLEADGNRFQRPQLLPETGRGEYLTVGAERAHELDLCDLVVQSRREFVGMISADRTTTTQLTWVDTTVYLLNRPWLTTLLLIVGLIGLYLEFAAPGISVAGLTAALCFGIFFWSHMLGGTSGWLEVLLFLLGIGCLLCEMFVLPGFGVFGVTGILLVIVGLVMASQDFLVPRGPAQWEQFRLNLLIVVGSVVGVLALLAIQVVFLDSIPGLNRLRLHPPAPEGQEEGGPSAARPELSGPKIDLPPIGTEGVAYSDLRPSGKAQFGERVVDVLTEGDFVEEGTPVRVLRHEGNRIIVRALKKH